MYIHRWFYKSTNSVVYVKDLLEYNYVANPDFVVYKRGVLCSMSGTGYEESNSRFIFTEIGFGDKKMRIQFKTDNYNFYLNGNVFDKPFIRYFMRRYYGELIDAYTLNIIDNNVNRIEVDERQSIVFYRDSYQVLSTECTPLKN